MNPPRPSGCRTATLEGGPRGRCLLPAHAAAAVPETLWRASKGPSALHGDHPTLHGPSKGWRLACGAEGDTQIRGIPASPAVWPQVQRGGEFSWGPGRNRGGRTRALADGAATDHTVQLEKRKSWGGDTPRPDRKEWEEGRRLGGKSGRLETMTAGEGSALGLGSPPPNPQPAAKPSFAASLARRGSGHWRLLIATSWSTL